MRTLVAVVVALALPVHDASAASRFDAYVLSLSWSPSYCAKNPGNAWQCSPRKRLGFVAHGLWPQYDRARRSDCDAHPRLDGALVDRMLDIMPTPGLVRHEWDTHGRCSGLDAEAYFTAVRRAFESVTIPDAFQDLPHAREVSVADLKAEFERANASIRTDGIAVVCDGRYLEEVRLCFDPTLRPRRCLGDVRDRCRPGTLIVLPAR